MDWVKFCLIGSWILLFISICIKLEAKDPNVSRIAVIMILLFIPATGRVFNWW